MRRNEPSGKSITSSAVKWNSSLIFPVNTWSRLSKVRKPKDTVGLTNEGYSFTFHENGYLAVKSFYKDGKLEGEAIIYDFFGNPETINTYKNGKLINTKNLNAK